MNVFAAYSRLSALTIAMFNAVGAAYAPECEIFRPL
jgi:hypothetical protein